MLRASKEKLPAKKEVLSLVWKFQCCLNPFLLRKILTLKLLGILCGLMLGIYWSSGLTYWVFYVDLFCSSPF